MSDKLADKRRRYLVQALGMGLFATGPIASLNQPALALGSMSPKLPPGRSIYKLKGTVTVDGKPADINTFIGANSLIKTGPSSRVIFAVGTDAFILRSKGELQLGGDNMLIEGMRMFTGKLLSVFGKRVRPHKITTMTATIGIRGTGIYIESDEQKSYVCTCYGHTEISSNENPQERVDVKTTHHESPLYILPGKAGKVIVPAGLVNHTDAELELIEQLVGRHTPFDPLASGEDY
ncbi:MAG: hypothetical protein GY744_12465 [Gammaproteobacteria bacterium]|nr:hypothetical protein [Gammaproteobacteria bacterium]